MKEFTHTFSSIEITIGTNHKPDQHTLTGTKGKVSAGNFSIRFPDLSIAYSEGDDALCLSNVDGTKRFVCSEKVSVGRRRSDGGNRRLSTPVGGSRKLTEFVERLRQCVEGHQQRSDRKKESPTRKRQSDTANSFPCTPLLSPSLRKKNRKIYGKSNRYSSGGDWTTDNIESFHQTEPEKRKRHVLEEDEEEHPVTVERPSLKNKSQIAPIPTSFPCSFDPVKRLDEVTTVMPEDESETVKNPVDIFLNTTAEESRGSVAVTDEESSSATAEETPPPGPTAQSNLISSFFQPNFKKATLGKPPKSSSPSYEELLVMPPKATLSQIRPSSEKLVLDEVPDSSPLTTPAKKSLSQYFAAATPRKNIPKTAHPTSPLIHSTQHPPPTPSLPGLLNLGNTCYLNASLRMLFSLPSFLSSLSSTNPRPPLLSSLLDLHQKLSTPQFKSVDATQLKKLIDEKTSSFLGNEQRDAHEFLVEMLDWLEEDAGSSAKEIVDAKKEDLFCLKVRVCLTCEGCGYERSREEMYRHLSLDVPEGDKGWSIEKGLETFFQPEKREVDCEKCEGGKTATQTMEIIQLPRALLLHLKRFLVVRKTESKNDNLSSFGNTTVQKIQIPVRFKTELHLTPFYRPDLQTLIPLIEDPMSSPTAARTPPQYQLTSIVHHIGSTAFCGHYTSDVKYAPSVIEGKAVGNKWTGMDDSKSITKDWNEVGGLSSQRSAYMLLYELQV